MAVDVGAVSLPADGRAASLARRLVRSHLESWELEDVLDTAMLLTSEVVSNVIVHTVSAPVLELARVDGDGVRVTVVDGSPVPPRLRWHSATAMTGRGVQLLEDLADDWGWTPVGDGKAVWFVVRGSNDRWEQAHPHPAAPPEPEPAAAPSPLGRYSAPTTTAELVTVRLLGVPVRVLVAAREHHDGLMRELRLLAMTDMSTLSTRLAELTRSLGVRFASAGARPDDDVERALARQLATVDLVYRVPPGAADSAQRLDELMGEADDLCRSAQLITLPRSAVIARFGRWYVEEFVEQTAGAPARRWDGPLDPDLP
jgi:anti-sigma regulatory factor (Ser/Thr protein kinase)